MNGIVGIMARQFGEPAILNGVLWTEPSRALQAYKEIMEGKCTQRMHNHIPGLQDCLRKSGLTTLINVFRKRFPEQYAFFPRSWDLTSSDERASFRQSFEANKTYILKPSNGHQGAGIKLAQDWKDVDAYLNATNYRPCVAQEYVTRPLLLHHLKFDLRVYVLLESVSPLRFAVFHEGLARFCTSHYTAPAPDNLSKDYMHLTNYSLNVKNSETFVQPDSPLTPSSPHTAAESLAELERAGYASASKRSISMVLKQLHEAGVPSQLE